MQRAQWIYNCKEHKFEIYSSIQRKKYRGANFNKGNSSFTSRSELVIQLEIEYKPSKSSEEHHTRKRNKYSKTKTATKISIILKLINQQRGKYFSAQNGLTLRQLLNLVFTNPLLMKLLKN